MHETLAETTKQLIAQSPWLAFGAVFLGGLLTASNPCVLAMIPLSVAHVGGVEGATNWRRCSSFRQGRWPVRRIRGRREGLCPSRTFASLSAWR